MTKNFDCALVRAKWLINTGRKLRDVVKEIIDDYALTEYEAEELTEELSILSMGEGNDYE